MQLNRRGFYSERGLTLMEVLFALLISGIFLVTALSLLTDQWRGARALKNHLEAHYAVMTTGKTLSDAIRMAKTVEWISDSRVLKVLPLPDDTNPIPSLDSYFIADLDGDGTKDLYWKHKDVPSPLASYISNWECTEVEPGLWEIYLQASLDGQIVTWRCINRQRTHSLSSESTGQQVLLAF